MRSRLLTQDWTLKLFSLIVAILLFLFVSFESATATDVEYAIEYRPPPDIMLTDVATTKIRVTMKGPWAAFRSFNNPPPIVIDLTDNEPGPVLYRIDRSAFVVPAGMKVLSWRPAELEIELDRRVEKLVSVEIDPLGRPAFGYEISEMRADPPRVRVEGPMSKIRILDFVHTRPVDLSERNSDLTIDVELRPPPPPLRLVDRHNVSVLIDISEDFIERDFAEIPVKLENAPRGTRVTPSVVLVTLKGPRRIVDRLGNNSLEAWVDARPDPKHNGDRTFEMQIQIRPELPERTQILGTIPKVQITLPRRRRRN